MEERKTRVTRLSKVREQLVYLRSCAVEKQTTAAAKGDYYEAITHKDYALATSLIISLCDEK